MPPPAVVWLRGLVETSHVQMAGEAQRAMQHHGVPTAVIAAVQMQSIASRSGWQIALNCQEMPEAAEEACRLRDHLYGKFWGEGVLDARLADSSAAAAPQPGMLPAQRPADPTQQRRPYADRAQLPQRCRLSCSMAVSSFMGLCRCCWGDSMTDVQAAAPDGQQLCRSRDHPAAQGAEQAQQPGPGISGARQTAPPAGISKQSTDTAGPAAGPSATPADASDVAAPESAERSGPQVTWGWISADGARLPFVIPPDNLRELERKYQHVQCLPADQQRGSAERFAELNVTCPRRAFASCRLMPPAPLPCGC